MATMNSSLAPIKVSVSDRHKVVAASFVGNFVEWFDYASYGYLATMIAAAFFPTRNPTAGLLATFGVFAISFAVRPFGGMVWGRIGDRMGRKTALAPRVRYTGFAFSFNAANALFGGTAPFVATLLISLTGSKLAPAWYLVAAATVTLAAMLASKETAGKPLQ
jgi:MFS family permease